MPPCGLPGKGIRKSWGGAQARPGSESWERPRAEEGPCWGVPCLPPHPMGWLIICLGQRDSGWTTGITANTRKTIHELSTNIKNHKHIDCTEVDISLVQMILRCRSVGASQFPQSLQLLIHPPQQQSSSISRTQPSLHPREKMGPEASAGPSAQCAEGPPKLFRVKRRAE